MSVAGYLKTLIRLKMPRAYSNNLWWRLVRRYLFQQEEIGSISSRLHVSEKTVYSILYLYLSIGDVSPRKQRSCSVRKLSDCEELQLLDGGVGLGCCRCTDIRYSCWRTWADLPPVLGLRFWLSTKQGSNRRLIWAGTASTNHCFD